GQYQRSRTTEEASIEVTSDFLEEVLPSHPGFVASFLVRFVFVSRVFAGPHKTVSRSLVGYRFKGLPCCLHHFLGLGNRLIDASIVSSVDPVNRTLDLCYRVCAIRSGAVKNKRSLERGTVGCESKTLGTTVAESGYRNLAVASWKFRYVVCDDVEIAGDL